QRSHHPPPDRKLLSTQRGNDGGCRGAEERRAEPLPLLHRRYSTRAPADLGVGRSRGGASAPPWGKGAAPGSSSTRAVPLPYASNAYESFDLCVVRMFSTS